MSRRSLAVGLPLLALAGIVAGALTAAGARRSDGPLRSSSTNSVEFAVADDTVVSWGMVLPRNPTMGDIRIDSIEPATIDGLEVLGIRVNQVGPNGEGSVTNALGFPPFQVGTRPPDGSILRAAGEPPDLQVLLGVRRPRASSVGWIGGLRIRYEAGGAGYEVVLPWSLRILRPGGALLTGSRNLSSHLQAGGDPSRRQG
jgi:hypothetical protein